MRNAFVMFFAVIVTLSSCKKTCFREVVYSDGTKVTEQYEAMSCDASYGSGSGCATCGTGGGTYTIFNPNAYSPEYDVMTVTGVVINAPQFFNGYWQQAQAGSTDFAQRKQRQNLSSFAAIPDMDRNTFVDTDGSNGVDKNKMVIWVYTQEFGAMEVVVDANRVISSTGLQLGSSVSVTASFNLTLPYGVLGEPQQSYANKPMSTITGKGIYGKI